MHCTPPTSPLAHTNWGALCLSKNITGEGPCPSSPQWWGYNRNLIAGPKWSPLLTTDMFPPHQPADLWLSSPFPCKNINFSFPVLSDLALLSPIPLLSRPAAHGLAATSAWSTGLVLFSPSQDCTAAKQNIWTSHWSSFGRQFWRTVMRDGGWAASSYCTVSCWTSGFWWGSPISFGCTNENCVCGAGHMLSYGLVLCIPVTGTHLSPSYQRGCKNCPLCSVKVMYKMEF